LNPEAELIRLKLIGRKPSLAKNAASEHLVEVDPHGLPSENQAGQTEMTNSTEPLRAFRCLLGSPVM
jgi:hypothetical protein